MQKVLVPLYATIPTFSWRVFVDAPVTYWSLTGVTMHVTCGTGVWSVPRRTRPVLSVDRCDVGNRECHIYLSQLTNRLSWPAVHLSNAGCRPGRHVPLCQLSSTSESICRLTPPPTGFKHMVNHEEHTLPAAVQDKSQCSSWKAVCVG